MSITSTIVRPTNIGGFFHLVKLTRTSLSGVSCHVFRRNVTFGKISVCGLREFKPLAALFGRVDVAFPPRAIAQSW